MLHPTAASGHDQDLAERMGVPGCSGAGLEGDTGAVRAGWFVRLEQRVNPYIASKILGWSFAGRL
jgi:hypothetical protein